MASTNNLTTSQLGDRTWRRRSSSVSPSHSPLPSPPLKRKRTWNPFQRSSLSQSGHDCGQPLDSHALRHRKSFIDYVWKPQKTGGYQKMPESNDRSGQQEKSENMSAEQNPTSYANSVSHANMAFRVNSASQEKTQEPGRPRPSRFSSVSSAVKKGFYKVTCRKDSALDVYPASLGCGVDLNSNQLIFSAEGESQERREEVYNFTPNLEPLAQVGMLRFENRSMDVLQSADGPSTYCSRESYQNRKHWFPEDPDTPPPITNAKAGVDPQRWQRLNGQSQPPISTRDRTRSRQYSFWKPKSKPRDDRKDKTAVSPVNSRWPSPAPKVMTVQSARGVSCTQSTAPPAFSISDPNIFGARPNLQFPLSSDQIGVLPTLDTASIENSADIPHPAYSYDNSPSSSIITLHYPHADDTYHPSWSNQNLLQSRSSSFRDLRPSSLYPATPSLNPAMVSPSSTSTLTLNLPPPSLSCRAPSHAHSTPDLLSPHSPGYSDTTQGTAVDDASGHEGLGLRRMSSLANILEAYHVDGQGRLSFGDAGVAAPQCGVHCCGSRGRSRVRRSHGTVVDPK